jgi:hypothetical protein
MTLSTPFVLPVRRSFSEDVSDFLSKAKEIVSKDQNKKLIWFDTFLFIAFPKTLTTNGRRSNNQLGMV